LSFDFQCHLGLWERLQQRFDICISEHKKFDADFFQSLAAVMINNKIEGYKRVATISLEMVIRKTPEEPDANRHVIYWRWLIQTLFENLKWEETLSGQFLEIMEQLTAFVRKLGSRYPQPELRWLVNRIWSSLLLLRRSRKELRRFESV
jgi:uncharacterized protein YlxP (DUF503 family)